MKVYSIWTEDEGSWFPQYLTANKEKAQRDLEEYCRNNNVEYWLHGALAIVVEANLDLKDKG